jgi:hypothetical protein
MAIASWHDACRAGQQTPAVTRNGTPDGATSIAVALLVNACE